MNLSLNAFADMEATPKNLSCTLQEFSSYRTKVEKVVQEKTIRPQLKYEESVGADLVLIKRKSFDITLEVSFLNYHPLVTTYVNASSTVIDAGLEASVRDPQTGNQIVVTCSYDKN